MILSNFKLPRIPLLPLLLPLRHITDEEFSRLLAAAAAGKPIRGVGGPDRVMLYTVAAYTGLRASELASLTPASFSLDAAPPTLTVAAAYSKHRREDTVPLHADLVRDLRPWLAPRDRSAVLWPGKWAEQFTAAAMLRKDLDAARRAWIAEGVTEADRGGRAASDFLSYKDRNGGTADFHALRHTFITNLVNAGVQPKDAKELARHSTITLTMDRYAHVGIRDTAAALAKLPGLAPPEAGTVTGDGVNGGVAGAATGAATGGDWRESVRAGEEIRSVAAEAIPQLGLKKEPLPGQGFEDDRGQSETTCQAEREGFEATLGTLRMRRL